MTITYDHETSYEADPVMPEAPKTRRRHPKRTDPMHTHPTYGPILAREVREHARNIEVSSDETDTRAATRVELLRRWAAEIEAGLGGVR